jgi:hypothetical protein
LPEGKFLSRPLNKSVRWTIWFNKTRFVDDGRIELDNNVVERSIRLITRNRKNARSQVPTPTTGPSSHPWSKPVS